MSQTVRAHRRCPGRNPGGRVLLVRVCYRTRLLTFPVPVHTRNAGTCLQTKRIPSELYMVLYLGMYITWLHAEMWHKTKGEAVRCLSRRTEWGEKLTARQIEAMLRTVTLFKIGKGAGDREHAEQDSSYTWLPPRGKRRMQAEAMTMRTSSINATIREMPRHETTRRQAEWMHLFANAKAHVSLFANCVLKSAQGFYVFTPQFKMMAQVVFNNVSLDRTNTYAEEQALGEAMLQGVAGVQRVTASAAEFIGNEARGWAHGTTKPPFFPTCGREWFDAWLAWDDNTTLCELVARLVQAAREHTERHQRAFASTLCVDYDMPGSSHCLPFAREGARLHIVPTLDESDETETDWDASSDDAPAQESLDVYDTDAPRIWTGRDAERGDVRGGAASGGDDDAVGRGDVGGRGDDVVRGDAGELDEGAGTGPDADPVQRPAMGGPLLRRQNARVLRDACVGAVTEPHPRLTMGDVVRSDAGELDEGAGTEPDADPVPRLTMRGPLLRRQNARVIRDACVGAVTEPHPRLTMRDVGRGDAGELDADADPVPRLTMGGPLLRRQNARVIRDAWPDPSSHPARDESAAKKAKTLSHPTGHGAGGVG